MKLEKVKMQRRYLQHIKTYHVLMSRIYKQYFLQ